MGFGWWRMDPLTCLGSSLLSAEVTKRMQPDILLSSKLTQVYLHGSGRISKIRKETCKASRGSGLASTGWCLCCYKLFAQTKYMAITDIKGRKTEFTFEIKKSIKSSFFFICNISHRSLVCCLVLPSFSFKCWSCYKISCGGFPTQFCFIQKSEWWLSVF